VIDGLLVSDRSRDLRWAGPELAAGPRSGRLDGSRVVTCLLRPVRAAVGVIRLDPSRAFSLRVGASACDGTSPVNVTAKEQLV